MPPHPELMPYHHQKPSQPGPHASTLQPSWAYPEQRPQASHYDSYAFDTHGGPVVHGLPQNQLVLEPRTHPSSSPEGIPRSAVPSNKLNLALVTNLLTSNVPDCPILQQGAQYFNHRTVLCDLLASKFDNVITSIDRERFSGDERELAVHEPLRPMWQQQETEYTDRSLRKRRSKDMIKDPNSLAPSSTNYFAKAYLYANSKLPQNLPLLKL